MMGLGEWGKRWPGYVCLLFVITTNAHGVTLREVSNAAKVRGLPMRFFREISAWNGWDRVTIGTSDAARYYPWSNRIELPESQTAKPPTHWGVIDWANFYNELFHAWWDNVFLPGEIYKPTRARLAILRKRYAIACPDDPALAQEEAFSETTSALVLYLANKVPLSDLAYDTSRTVGAVGHGERPGFSATADETYLSEEEYAMIFRWLTGTNPPDA